MVSFNTENTTISHGINIIIGNLKETMVDRTAKNGKPQNFLL